MVNIVKLHRIYYKRLRLENIYRFDFNMHGTISLNLIDS